MSSHHSEIIDLSNFQKEQKINQGKDFILYKIINKKTNAQYTAKLLKNMHKYPKYKIDEILNEINIISMINHPSIIKYFGYSPTDFKNNPQSVIITEYAVRELACDIYKKDEILNLKSRKFITLYGIASAMLYLHSHNIIHCNLNISNVHLDESYLPKISGFEFSRKVNENDQNKKIINRFSHIVGKIDYVAPEIFSRKEYSKKSDVYSFGFILYEIFRQLRFPNHLFLNNFYYMKQVVSDKKRPNLEFECFSPFYKGLIEKCWSANPDDRPTFSEIVEILRNEPSLINNEDYQNYIKFIDDSQWISFDSKKEFCNYDDILNNCHIEFQEEEEKIEENKSRFMRKKPCGENIFGLTYYFQKRNTEELYLGQEFIFLEDFSDNDINIFMQQASILSQIKHPSIYNLISIKFPKIGQNLKPIIITEKSDGFLSFMLENEQFIEVWDDTQKLIIIYGIAHGMSYLHSHNIIHRDLKPDNIHLDNLLFPKISGFCLSMKIPPNSDKIIMKNIQGTPAYLSPEVYLYKQYGKASDVYAFSLIVYQLMTNKKPFEGCNTNL